MLFLEIVLRGECAYKAQWKHLNLLAPGLHRRALSPGPLFLLNVQKVSKSFCG